MQLYTDDIKREIKEKELEGVYRIYVAQNREQWLAFVNLVMKLGSIEGRELLN
jgi:hypothetical protein